MVSVYIQRGQVLLTQVTKQHFNAWRKKNKHLLSHILMKLTNTVIFEPLQETVYSGFVVFSKSGII